MIFHLWDDVLLFGLQENRKLIVQLEIPAFASNDLDSPVLPIHVPDQFFRDNVMFEFSKKCFVTDPSFSERKIHYPTPIEPDQLEPDGEALLTLSTGMFVNPATTEAFVICCPVSDKRYNSVTLSGKWFDVG